MTNLFPQQRFFAIIIFISFCLHTALFFSGTVQQMEKSRVYKSERILNQLTNEFSFPLVYADRVSLSVVTNRYAKEYGINHIIIRDANDKILVESGVDPMLGGQEFETEINVGKTIIGHIAITLKSASHAEIIKFLWLFIITSLTIHLGVWFLYLSCSTPTEEDLQKIRDKMYEDYLQQSNTGVKRPRKQAPKKVLMELADYILEYKQNKTVNAVNINKPLQKASEKVEQQTASSETITVSQAQAENKDKIKEKQTISEEINTNNKIIANTKKRTEVRKGHSILSPKKISKTKTKQSAVTNIELDIDKQAKKIVQVKQSKLIKKAHDRPSILSGQPPFTKLSVEFRYVDKYQLLNKIMPMIANSYFELCSQFLQMAINHLLTDERLEGVSLVNQPSFSIKGASVELQTTTNDQKQLLLASTMLANLYQMINQVVYDARREAKVFAFQMNIGISDIEQDSLLNKVTEFNKDENVIMSLQYSALKLIKDEAVINKNTQQQYYYLENMNQQLLSMLMRIRNNILQME